MGFLDWFTGNSEDPRVAAERQRRQDESRRRIEAGGIPLNATERLQHQASKQNTPGHFWTSDLSVAELSLVREAGYQPLGQVMGSSVYHIGFQWRTQTWRNSYWQGGGASYELDVLTKAFYNARQLALSRLCQEAALLGATGVVGVRLTHKKYTWGEDLLEFIVIGTAIRENDRAHAAAHGLFLSELSGEEFWKLHQAGYRPINIVVGNCSYYQIPGWTTQNMTTGGWFGLGSWQNVEVQDYTQAMYTARELAMERMEAEARAAGATGIVSVDVDMEATPIHIENNNNRRIDMMYNFTSIGTAIKPFSSAKSPLAVHLTLPLRPNYLLSGR